MKYPDPAHARVGEQACTPPSTGAGVVSNVPRKDRGIGRDAVAQTDVAPKASRTVSRPASWPTRTLIVLRERMRPVSAGSTPPKVPSEFAGLHFGANGSSPGWMAASLMFAPGSSPFDHATV